MKRLWIGLLCLSLLGGMVGCTTGPAPEESSLSSENVSTTSTSDSRTSIIAATPTSKTTTTTSGTAERPITTTRVPAPQPLSAFALVQADDTADQDRVYTGCGDGMAGYYTRVLPAFLADAKGGNRVCSPLNVYLALGMLAETAQGNTRQQLLDLMGEDGMEEVRRRSAALWNVLFRDEKKTTCLLANSLWLDARNPAAYREETVKRLAEDYFASVFRGEMGSKAYNVAARDWIDEHTGGLLKNQIGDNAFDADDVLGLVSAIYYKAAWANAFSEDKTEKGTFHASAKDVECDFMHDSMLDTFCWEGSNFLAARRAMYGGFAMWFVLPNAGVDAKDLAASPEVIRTLLGEDGAQSVACDLVWRIPRFDVTSQKPLNDSLKSLGVTEVFAPDTADLSGMFGVSGSNGQYYVSGINHTARLILDEKGVEAAAYTRITVSKGAIQDNERKTVCFTADRPFLFAVTGPQDTLLFAGILEDPTKSGTA